MYFARKNSIPSYFLVTILSFVFVLVGTITVDAKFWTPPRNTSACASGSAVMRLPVKTSVDGGYRSSGVKFVNAVGINLSRAVRSRNYDTRAFADEFVRAAQAGAYTKLGRKGSGGSSPVFVSSAILVSAAYAVSLFDQRFAWTPEERKVVVAWGNKINRNQNHKKQYASVDSISAIAGARMSWGAATGQRGIFNSGMRDFKRNLRRIRNDGMFEKNLRDNNENFGPLLIGAEAAMRSGVNVYSMSFGGKTLHDAVRIHSEKSVAAGAKKFKETGGSDKARTYMRPHGFAAHVAWIPIYLSRFPNSHAAPAVRNLRAAVMKRKPGAFHGITVGGPSECLWGRS